ncbi:hypothetical protein BX666DRAFT_2111379, partial [Dichotomocladium elegans]
MSHDLEFEQGVMKLSSFDPKLNRVETRVLRLPDVPTFESLEHLFMNTYTPSSPSCCSSSSSSSPDHQQATMTTRFIEVFQTEPTLLRSTRSLTANKKSTASRVPRRCYSNPYFSKKKEVLLTESSTVPDTWMSTAPRRTPSRRNLLRAFTGLLQRAASVRRSASSTSLKRSSISIRDEQDGWHTETYTIEMRLSFDRPRPLKKRCHAENWWAASPSLVAHAL